MGLPFDVLIMQADRKVIYSECILMEANNPINNLKHWQSFWASSTKNKMNGTVHEAKQKPFQYWMEKTPDLTWIQEIIVILWYTATFLYCRLVSVMLAGFFTFTIIIIIDRFIWGKKWSFRKAWGVSVEPRSRCAL